MDDQITLAELRFHSTGWVARVGVFCLRWSRQDMYWSFSFERVRKGFQNCGGMTARQFYYARKQAREARKAKEGAVS